MELTHALLALRLLFRTEYGDPGQKGANPPTIGSEQGYYKVSNVQIKIYVVFLDIFNCLTG